MLIQTFESMSSLRWHCDGMGSMVSKVFILGFVFQPPPIDSFLPSCPRWNDIGGLLLLYYINFFCIKLIQRKNKIIDFFWCLRVAL